jgi:uncharacterized membrane protein YGL010W
MKHTVTLTSTSLLTVLFTTFHLRVDIVRGMSPGGLSNLPVVLVLVVWLYGTLVLAERRRGTSSSSARRSLRRASISST